MSARNRPGAVHALLTPLAKHGVSMTRIESRPARMGTWEYMFFVDIEGHQDDAAVAAALAELRALAPFLKVLGSYPPPFRNRSAMSAVHQSASVLADLCELSPSYIRAIAPYQPGKPISELAREMGLDEKSHRQARLEREPARHRRRARARRSSAAIAELARYPDGNGFELKRRSPRATASASTQIVLGNGSNDVLELVARAFLAPGRSAVYSQHAFAVYPLATQARGARGIVVPAKDCAVCHFDLVHGFGCDRIGLCNLPVDLVHRGGQLVGC